MPCCVVEEKFLQFKEISLLFFFFEFEKEMSAQLYRTYVMWLINIFFNLKNKLSSFKDNAFKLILSQVFASTVVEKKIFF